MVVFYYNPHHSQWYFKGSEHAKIDPKILDHLVEKEIDYCMELAEIAQNSVKDSTEKFKLVDTGSLWLNVRAIKRLLDTDELKIEDFSVSKETESDQVLL